MSLNGRPALRKEGTLAEKLQQGIDDGFAFYERQNSMERELGFYRRLRDLAQFASLERNAIRSSGYVVDSLEAAVWCLLQTDTFRDALLTAVNLGEDTDTVGAICGGLAGLQYGYTGMPEEWLSVIQRRECIEELCQGMAKETARTGKTKC